MTWPEDRKLAELERKLSSIELEFAHWQAETSAKGTLPKHNSQVIRVTRQLGTLVVGISNWLNEAKKDPTRLAGESHDVELMILDVHKIWDYFRSKLSQHHISLFSPYLIATNEFAWACYEPAQAAANPALIAPERVKEPPLVFLNGESSPFAVSRGTRFEPEFVEDEEITRPTYLQVLKNLPISVVGLPWYQIRHLPDAVAIGHEVGHNVEDDFGLTGRLSALLESALETHPIPDERRDGWRAWLGEIFADIYGILATGPAFVSCLMDFLALSSPEIMTATQPDPIWRPHPPDALRMSLNFKTLELLDFETEATKLRATWTTRFPNHAMEAFEDDIEAVVNAILDGPYPEFGDVCLPKVISFGPDEVTWATTFRNDLANGFLSAVHIRPIMAGARLAFEANPANYFKKNADQVVLDKIRAAQTSAVRGAKETDPLEELDVAAGQRLFEMMRGLHSTSPNAPVTTGTE
jgi:hypothetical protein